NSRSVWAMFRASSGNARCVGLPFVRFLHRAETLHSLGTDRRKNFRMKAVRSGRRCASTGLGSLHRSLFAAIAPLLLVLVGAPRLALSHEGHDPDFDLRIDCHPDLVLGPGESVRLESGVILTTRDNHTGVGVKGWSLGIAAVGAAKVVEATFSETAGAPVPFGYLDNGFSRIEMTTGEANEGVTAAIVLSFMNDTSLPLEGEATLLRVTIDVVAPGVGCAESGLVFRDGLRGSGQPVENVINWNGKSRKDDGGEKDGDSDSYDECLLRV